MIVQYIISPVADALQHVELRVHVHEAVGEERAGPRASGRDSGIFCLLFCVCCPGESGKGRAVQSALD